MLFNSWQFAVFFTVVFFTYFALPHKFRWILLLIASYYFYMSWNPELVVLIAGVTLDTYLAGRLLARPGRSARQRKWILAVGVTTPLLVLFFFKYFNFFAGAAEAALALVSIPIHSRALDIILPVGISFYTFQSLAYVIDVYRGDIEAQKHLGIYALFISFFPQLVAGPIERSRNLMPQFFEEHRFDYQNASDGIRIMAVGFFKKLVVADVLSKYVDFVYNSLPDQKGFSLILATVLFAFQIYCDFSGYSDIAIGAARMLGFRLMKNFDSPYLSHSIKEFWHRWHISLSTWFGDYVYIPLGGNRVKLPRYYFNLFITFLISGLWHGANWTFLVWGALHGVYRIAGAFRETAQKRRGLLPAPATTGLRGAMDIAFTFFLVTVGWVFFRANTVQDAFYVFRHCFDGIGSIFQYLRNGFVFTSMDSGAFLQALVSLCALALIDISSKKTDMLRWLDARRPVFRWGIYTAFICLIAILSEKGIAARFIYFQF